MTSPDPGGAPTGLGPPEPPKRPSLWRFARPVIALVVIVVAGLGVVSAAAWLGETVGGRVGSDSAADGAADIEPGVEVEVEIPAGSSGATIGQILEDQGVVRSATQFQAAVRAADAGAELKAGRYRLVTGMAPEEVIEVLRRGPVPETFQVTIPEGLRVTEILPRLAEESGLSVAELEDALLSGEVTTDLRELPAEATLSDWEGLLFPDTYQFAPQSSAATVLQRLSDTMLERVESVDWSRLEEAGYSVYEGIVIASLIESEVRVAEERPLVSSVIWNRLADGQRLEIDATVLYALETRDVSEFDRDLDSPYNTYAVEGLPPTPISAPGLASLEAAADPADTEYRYYVRTDEDGGHTFSETFEEHQAARQEACEAGFVDC